VEGRPLEDAELVDRARGGDVRAYELLVVRYRELAVRTAYLITRDGSDAQDVAQEAFVKAYLALSTFRRDAPFRPWMLAIVANEARNRARSSRRRAALTLRAASVAQPATEGASPEAAALRDEDRRALVDALERLGEADRLVLGYRYFLDLSEAEIAAALDCRRGTVKSRLSRALRRLRTELDADPAAPAEIQRAADG
jgi:RNA polymerase sigma factor (sigma-70 family)